MDRFASRLIVALSLAMMALPARAEMGPCKQQTLENGEFLICGSGTGSAMVIPDTISPNKKCALAWRDPTGVPTEESDDDNEVLLVRISDGMILGKNTTDYFNTGSIRANRKSESADWSPDSRMVVRRYDGRYDTGAVDLFVIAPDGASAAMLDLFKIIQPAATEALKRRKKDADAFSFSIQGKPRSLGNDGTYRFPAMFFQAKAGVEFDYKMILKIIRDNKDASKPPEASVVSVTAAKS